jgi:hypothetical protein
MARHRSSASTGSTTSFSRRAWCWEAQILGAEWLTFDLLAAQVPAMMRAAERLAREVKPAAA